jgi:L-ascorbate metabolism protein UlaG (beta-lactamase superfamily)
VGGQGGTMDHAAAYKLAVQLEPKVVVPMHYDEKSLKAFLKEAGAEDTKPLERLTVKKKDLDSKEAEVIVLQS